ncbi:TPA: hypothetical protein RZK16_001730 [Campylobacter coli]|nr:hypothetical protein [Campylobacter coli]
MLSSFQVSNTPFGAIINYERNKEFCGGIYNDGSKWQEVLDDKFNQLSKDENHKNINKNDFLNIYNDNNSNYVSNEITKYINNIKDLNGNKIDFNSLNSKQQSLIISFLRTPLEQTNIYGTRAKLSDIKIDLNNNNELYIEANLHTIDGKTLSMGAEFSMQAMNENKYGSYGFLEHNGSQIYKFSFASEENLSTSERKNLLTNIRNTDIKTLDNFKENIDISLCFDNDGAEGGFTSFYMYSKSNFELDIQKANENIKNLPKEENEKEFSNFILVNIYWNKIRKDLENLKTTLKNKQEDLFIKNSTSPLKDILKNNI